MTNVAKLRLSVDSKGVTRSRNELGRFTKSAKNAETATGGLKKSGGALARTMVGLGAVLVTVGATVTKITRDWLKFNKAMLEVQTIAGVTEIEMKGIRMEALKLSQTLGVDATDAARGFYAAISAGVSSKEAGGFVKQAALLAQAGVSDIASSTQLLTGAMNSYGKSTSEATHVSDMLFKTVALGVTTIPQLAQSLSRASVSAANSGVKMKELLGVAAALTKQGTPTAEAMTQIKASVTALLNPSKELAFLYEKVGIESGRAAIEQFGLAGTLDMVRAAADGNDSMFIKAMRSSEAYNGALGITGKKLREVQKITKEIGEANGETADAAAITQQEISVAFEKLGGSFGILAENIDKALGSNEKLVASIGKLSNIIADPDLGSAFYEALTTGPERFARWFLTGKGYIEQTNDEIDRMVLSEQTLSKYHEARSKALQIQAMATHDVNSRARSLIKTERELHDAVKRRDYDAAIVAKDRLKLIHRGIAALEGQSATQQAFQIQIERVNELLRKGLITKEQWKTSTDGIIAGYEKLNNEGDILHQGISNIRDRVNEAKRGFEGWSTGLIKAAEDSSPFLRRLINIKEIKLSQSKLDEIMLGYEDDKLKTLIEQDEAYKDHIAKGGTLTAIHQGIWNIIRGQLGDQKKLNNELTKSPELKAYEATFDALRTDKENATAELNRAQIAIAGATGKTIEERTDLLTRATNRYLDQTTDPETKSRPTATGGGGGFDSSREAEQTARAFDQLNMSLMDEETAIMESHNRRYEIIMAATTKTLEEKKALEIKLQSDTQEKLAKAREAEFQQNLAHASNFFGDLSEVAAAFGKKGAKVAKGAAIAQATIDTYGSAVAAYKAMAGIPGVGPVLGGAAAAAAIAAGMANVAAIKAQPVGNYASGGIIPGASFAGDQLTANVNSGEMILNKAQQKNLLNMATGGGGGGPAGNVTIINKTRADIGEVQESRDNNGNLQLVISEAVRQTKDELTNEASLGGGNFLPAMERSYGLARQ